MDRLRKGLKTGTQQILFFIRRFSAFNLRISHITLSFFGESDRRRRKQMESKEKLELLQTAVKKLIEDEKKGSSSSVDSFVAVVKDGVEVDDDNRLLSKLLLQLESLEEDGMLGKQLDDEKAPSPEVGAKHEGRNEACNHCSETGNEEIVKELRKVRKQNLVTHCLLSVMIILTVAWQLSEVSILLKLKDGLSHPFKSLGGVVKGMLKRPDNGNGGAEKLVVPSKQNPIVQAATLPGLKIPDLSHVEFPSFDFDSDED